MLIFNDVKFVFDNGFNIFFFCFCNKFEGFEYIFMVGKCYFFLVIGSGFVYYGFDF